MPFSAHYIKATFPPNISIEKFCQSAKRIIGVSSAAVVRDVFTTSASFKRCTVLHNAFPVCTTVYTSFKPTARAPWRWRRVVHYKTLVRSRSILVVAGSRKVRGTHQGVQQRSNLKMDLARSVLYRRSIENRTGRASFFALDKCGNVRWECRFKATFPANIFGKKNVARWSTEKIFESKLRRSCCT